MARVAFLSCVVATGIFSLPPCKAGSVPQSERRTLEVAARAAFEFMKTGDAAKAEGALPSVEEMERFFRSVLTSLKDEERARAEARLREQGGAAGALARMRETMLQRGKAARESAAQELDWAQAVFDRVSAPEQPRPFQKGVDADVASVRFAVKAGGAVYLFVAKEALRLPAGWSFVEGWQFEGPDVPEDQRLTAYANDLRSWSEAVRVASDKARSLRNRFEDPGSAAAGYDELRSELRVLLDLIPSARLRRVGVELDAALSSKRLNASDRVRAEELRSDARFLSMEVDGITSTLSSLGSRLRFDEMYARLEKDIASELSSATEATREHALRLAIVFGMNAAVPILVERYDAATDAAERSSSLSDLFETGGGAQASERLRTWLGDVTRPVEERVEAFRALRRWAPAEDRLALARAAGPDAFAFHVEQLIGEWDVAVVPLLGELPERRRAEMWEALLGPAPKGVAPEELWAVVGGSDMHEAQRQAERIRALDETSIAISLRDAALPEFARDLQAVIAGAMGERAIPIQAAPGAEEKLSMEHDGRGVVRPLLAAIRARGLAARVIDGKLVLGAPTDLAALGARLARVPSTSPDPTDPKWRREMRAWLGEVASIPFFCQEDAAASFLLGTHFFQGTRVVLPGLVARATGPLQLSEENLPRAALLRPLMERLDARLVLRDEGLVFGLAAEIDALPPEVTAERPAGLGAAWAEVQSTWGTSERLGDALRALPAEAVETILLDQTVLARLDDTPVARVHTDSADAWALVRLLLLGTPFEARAVGERVHIVAREQR